MNASYPILLFVFVFFLFYFGCTYNEGLIFNNNKSYVKKARFDCDAGKIEMFCDGL